MIKFNDIILINENDIVTIWFTLLHIFDFGFRKEKDILKCYKKKKMVNTEKLNIM